MGKFWNEETQCYEDRRVMKDILYTRDAFKQRKKLDSKFGKCWHTQVLGYDDFGKLLFDEENITTLGGALFVLQKVFGKTNNIGGVHIPTLQNELGINYTTITGYDAAKEFVNLFAIGNGGATLTYGNVKDPNFTDTKLSNLFPIRSATEELKDASSPYYVMRKDTVEGKGERYRYFAKEFEGIEIKSLQHTSNETDGPVLDISAYDSYLGPIDVFAEMTLKIDKNDGREYYKDIDNVEPSRINCIGLYTGCKADADGRDEYVNCKLFSKLNFENEILQLSKGLTLVYRVYIA